LGLTEGTGTVALAGADGQWVVNDDPVKTFVLDADVVEHVAVVVPGPAAIVVRRPEARPVRTLDSTRPVFEVAVPDGGGVGLDPGVLADTIERATVALAAELVGTARTLLRMTIAYAKERRQFDRPIGSFQAVQHKLANMALAFERAESATYYAAMTV